MCLFDSSDTAVTDGYLWIYMKHVPRVDRRICISKPKTELNQKDVIVTNIQRRVRRREFDVYAWLFRQGLRGRQRLRGVWRSDLCT